MLYLLHELRANKEMMRRLKEQSRLFVEKQEKEIERLYKEKAKTVKK